MKKILGILILFLPFNLLACNSEKKHQIKICKIISIYDGDTFTLQDGQRVRLFGIDTPELKINGQKTKGQEFWAAQMAKQKLIALIKNKETKIKIITKDKYDRIVARLWANNQDINLSLINQGYARVAYINNEKTSIYNTNNESYLNKLLWAQKRAYEKNLFIWRNPQYFYKIFPKARNNKKD